MERKERAKTAATGGMTLVEVVVSLALLAVVALILVTGFSAAGKLIRRGTDTKNSTDKTISALEMLAGGLSPADEVDSTEEESTLTYCAGASGTKTRWLMAGSSGSVTVMVRPFTLRVAPFRV